MTLNGVLGEHWATTSGAGVLLDLAAARVTNRGRDSGCQNRAPPEAGPSTVRPPAIRRPSGPVQTGQAHTSKPKRGKFRLAGSSLV